MAQTYLDIREEITKIDDIRDAGLTTPEGIQRFDGLRYGSDEIFHTLDVYCPKGTDKPLPTIISVHGGGWIYGDRQRYSHYCMRLALRGFTVVNFSYRLAPECKYPAQLEDTCRAVKWVQENAEAYHIDLNNIFMLGDSAGGQLCFQFLTMLTNPGYASFFDFAPPKGLTVRACALNCGCYFIPVSRLVTPRRMGVMIESFLPEEYLSVVPQLRVAKYITADFPPAFVMTAHNDYLKRMAAPLCRKLKAKKVEHQLHIYGSKEQKEIGHCFHLNCRSDIADQCNDDECAFFRAHMA